MKQLIQKLWMVISLLVIVSAILLFSDLDQRNKSYIVKKYPSIAVLQSDSTPSQVSFLAGIMDNLAYEGLLASDRSNFKIFNAKLNLDTANIIANEIVNKPYELVITSGSMASECFADKNRFVHKQHIFAEVSNSSGGRIHFTHSDPNQVHNNMIGFETVKSAEMVFKLLKNLNSSIKRVGYFRNPDEPFSEICYKEIKSLSEEFELNLIVDSIKNTSDIERACKSILSKGAEVIYIACDSITRGSLNQIVKIADQSYIPIVTNNPEDVKMGVLCGVEVNYYKLGIETATLAIELLHGKNVSDFRVDTFSDERLFINTERISQLGYPWKISIETSEMIDNQYISSDSARFSIDFGDYTEKGMKPKLIQIENANHFVNLNKRFHRPMKVAMLTLVENRSLEESQDGVEAGMQWSGMKKDIDYHLKKYSAQGEISQLSQIIDAIVNDKPDVIVTVTTPAMLAVVSKVKEIPVVLTVTSDPDKLQVFKNGPQANICGVHDNPPLDKLIEMAQDYIPGLKIVGIVYDGSQMNSVLSVEKLREVGIEKNIRIIEATANSVTDLGPATQSLIQRGAQIIVESADNLATTGFSSIRKVADDANIPIFATEPQLVAEGATGAVGDSFFEWGKQSGKLVAKVLAGVSPSRLGIRETEIQIRIDPIKK